MAEATVTLTMVGRDRFVYDNRVIEAFVPFQATPDHAEYLLQTEVIDRATNMEYNVFVKGEADRPERLNANEHLAAAYYRERRQEKKGATRRPRERVKSEASADSDAG